MRATRAFMGTTTDNSQAHTLPNTAATPVDCGLTCVVTQELGSQSCPQACLVFWTIPGACVVRILRGLETFPHEEPRIEVRTTMVPQPMRSLHNARVSYGGLEHSDCTGNSSIQR